MSAYNRTLELDPTYALGYYSRGTVEQTKGDLDGAIADYSQAIQRDPKLAAADRNLARIKQGLSDPNGAINPAANVQNAISYNDRGIAKQKKGDLDGAIADFTQAIKLGAKSGDVAETPD